MTTRALTKPLAGVGEDGAAPLHLSRCVRPWCGFGNPCRRRPAVASIRGNPDEHLEPPGHICPQGSDRLGAGSTRTPEPHPAPDDQGRRPVAGGQAGTAALPPLHRSCWAPVIEEVRAIGAVPRCYTPATRLAHSFSLGRYTGVLAWHCRAIPLQLTRRAPSEPVAERICRRTLNVRRAGGASRYPTIEHTDLA